MMVWQQWCGNDVTTMMQWQRHNDAVATMMMATMMMQHSNGSSKDMATGAARTRQLQR